MLRNPDGVQFKVEIFPEPWSEATTHSIMSRARAAVKNNPNCLAGLRTSFIYNGHRVVIKPDYLLENEQWGVNTDLDSE